MPGDVMSSGIYYVLWMHKVIKCDMMFRKLRR